MAGPPLDFERRGTPRSDDRHLTEVLQQALKTLCASYKTVGEPEMAPMVSSSRR